MDTISVYKLGSSYRSEVYNSGKWIDGFYMERLEEKLKEYLDVKYVILTNSGTSALLAAYWVMKNNFSTLEVDPYTFPATYQPARLLGYKIKYRKHILENKLSVDLSSVTTLVHLYGQPNRLVSKSDNNILIEDACQAFGAEIQGVKVGTIGLIGCYSFYPTKSFHTCGHGGAVATNDEELYKKMKVFIQSGREGGRMTENIALNLKMDEIKAEFLLHELAHYEERINIQRDISKEYLQVIPSSQPFLTENKGDKVKQAWDMMATGTKNLREMAEIMNKMGLTVTSRGKTLSIRMQTAHRIFHNKFYAGILTSPTYKKEVNGQHTPMVTMEQFYRVQNILEGRRVGRIGVSVKKSRNHEKFPLRRIVKCAECGRGLTAGWSKGRTKKYPYYRCSNGCKNTSIRAEQLDEEVVELLRSITPKKECLELFTQYVVDEYEERLKHLKKAKNAADSEIQRLKDMRKVLVEKNMLGIYTDEIFMEQNALIEKKLVVAAVAKADSTLEKYDINKLADFIKKTLSDLGETYQNSTVTQVKALLGSIFPSGLEYTQNGTLNHQINPMYQAIFNFDTSRVAYCDLLCQNSNYFSAKLMGSPRLACAVGGAHASGFATA